MPVYFDLLVSSLVSFWSIKFLTFDKKKGIVLGFQGKKIILSLKALILFENIGING
jgi:hypothetical protein